MTFLQQGRKPTAAAPSKPALLRQHTCENGGSMCVWMYMYVPVCMYYRKRGSASYARWERERERERERYRDRRKWRHHCQAKIGDEFTLSLAKNSHNWQWVYTFPCQKFALFVTPVKWSPLWSWNSQWVHAFCSQNISPSLFRISQMERAARQVIKNSRPPAEAYIVLPIEKLNQINTKYYWK